MVPSVTTTDRDFMMSTPTGTRSIMTVKRGAGAAGVRPETARSQPLGPADVRIKVEAAGVAFGDLLLIAGLVRLTGPLVPGYDVAGTVLEIGANVTDVRVGASVAAATGGNGGYTTDIVVPDWRAVPIEDADPVTATALVLNYLTAYQMLTRTAPLPAGATVLVHSAAGGVGSALVELARLRGLRVFGTASGGKAALLRRLGAIPIDYRSEDFVARVRHEAPEGIDAIFDPLGPSTWRRGLPLLRAGGRLVPFGVSDILRNGRRSLPRLARAFITDPRIGGIGLFSRGHGIDGYASTPMVEQHHDWYRTDLAELVRLLRAGSIAPTIDRTYPLHEAGAALTKLGSGQVSGKIVLKPGTGGA